MNGGTVGRRAQTSDGTFCSTCGSATEPTSELCMSCGQPLVGNVPGVKCPQCGRVVDEQEGRCPTCGADLPTMPPPTPGQGKSLLEELKAFRRKGRVESAGMEQVPTAMPEETEAALLAELESLWKMSEPFEQVVAARRKRLEQMDKLVAAARRRVRELESSGKPAEVREREELKKQVQEVLLERDEILKIEYGITEMERIYRNIITMQQKELRSKEDALKARHQGFRKEIGIRDQERQAIADKEKELGEREAGLREKIAELESKLKAAEAPPKPAPPASPGPDDSPEGPSVTREQWLAAQREIQESLLKLRGSEGEIILPTAGNVRDLRVRVNELEESLEKATEERTGLAAEIAALREAEEHAREVLKEVDELLGKLPDKDIKKFARSAAYKKYEELMQRLGL